METDWFAPICAYCERTDASFWSEPANALSNGAFLIAAGASAWRASAWRERAAARRDRAALGLAALVAVVGIGSFLFHTFANRWSLLADVIPIAAFIYAYFLLALRRFFGLKPAWAIAGTLLFAALNFGLEPALDAAIGPSAVALSNGSILYVPAFLALLGVGSCLLNRDRAAGMSILAIAALFLLSLSFRTIDVAVCGRLPLGTHFLWHLLNAVVLYGLIAVAVRFRATRRAGETEKPPDTRRLGLEPGGAITPPRAPSPSIPSSSARGRSPPGG